ncbi:MAG: pilin N-terminal domain-containing protein [Enterococcus sp.]
MRRISLVFMLLVYFFYTNTAFALEKTVPLIIDTKLAGEKVAGTDEIYFDIFDLTSWSQKSGQTEKEIKEFWLNHYQSKKQFQQYVQQTALLKVNEQPVSTAADGIARTELPYQQQEHAAVYLLVASGETGKQEFLPMVLFMPEELPVESIRLYGKYQEIKQQEPIVEQQTSLENKVSIKRQLPQTNELTSNFILSGLLLAVIGGIGLIYQKHSRRRNK